MVPPVNGGKLFLKSCLQLRCYCSSIFKMHFHISNETLKKNPKIISESIPAESLAGCLLLSCIKFIPFMKAVLNSDRLASKLAL